MTSFAPEPEPSRDTGSWRVPRLAADAPSLYPAGHPADDGGWQTGPDEDWHTAPQPVIRAAPLAQPGSWPGQAPWPDSPDSWQDSQDPPAPWPDSQDPPARWPDSPLAALPAQPAGPGPSRWDDGPARPGPADPGRPDQSPRPARDGDEAWAMLGYLGVPFGSILAPLMVYLVRARSSAYVRQHAIQALNLSITLALYNICALIVAGILALDAVSVALMIVVPVTLALWLVTLAYLVRAAVQASLGEFYPLPRWLCATIAR
jgi:uncharacterized Tic20 family protein